MTITSTHTAAHARITPIDSLRVLAFGLLILYHLGMVYAANWSFHIKSSITVDWLWPLMLWSNQWRMDLLFIISGMVVMIMLQRQSSRHVAKRRTLHLGIPLLTGIFVWVPPQVYIELKNQGVIEHLDYWQFFYGYINPLEDLPFSYGRIEPLSWTWNHLWFLPYVLCYSLIAIALSTRLVKVRGYIAQDSKASLMLKILIVCIPVFIYWGITLLLHDAFPRTYAFKGDWFNHASYGFSFSMGCLFIMMPKVWKQLGHLALPSLLCAITTYSLVMLLNSGWEIPNLLQSFIEASNRWLWLLTVLGLAIRFLSTPHFWLEPLRKRIFCYYILHQTALIVFMYRLNDYSLNKQQEPILILIGMLIICELGYRLATRNKWLGWSLGVFHR